MNVRPLLLPAVAAVSVALVAAARFDETVALIAAFAGLAMVGLIAVVPSRPLLLFALLPVAVWVAQRPPWAGLIKAIIIAGVVLIVIGSLPLFERAKEAWLPFGAGSLGAFLAGFIAFNAGLLDNSGQALGLVVILIAFRAAMVYVAEANWLYAAGVGLCGTPALGATGLLIAGAETAFGLVAVGSPAKHRLAFLFGTPLAAVWLFV